MTTEPTFASPFAWRYGSAGMREIWSEAGKHRLWRRIWLELARAQEAAALVTAEQRADLERVVDSVDLERIAVIEADIHHDLMAAVKAYAEQAPVGGPIIHLGATSADIEDNADALRLRAGIDLILARQRALLRVLAERVLDLAHAPVMAFTHLQPAEPTTAGYRLCFHLQDLWSDFEDLQRVRGEIRGKGFKGAVGTRASYAALLAGTSTSAGQFEARMMDALGIAAFPVASQTYPRKQDWRVLSALSGLAASLSKLAYDLRLLQSPLSGEFAEPFGAHQVGSSAMPFKRNPIASEKIDSLGRLVASFTDVAWQNAALAFLERSLDDSANRREILPVAFLATEEMLLVAERIIRGLRFDQAAAHRTFDRFAPFAATEPVLLAAVSAGGDRQALHEHLRELSMQAWHDLSGGKPNPLPGLLADSPVLRRYLTADTVAELSAPQSHIGDAPERAIAFANDILSQLMPAEEL